MNDTNPLEPLFVHYHKRGINTANNVPITSHVLFKSFNITIEEIYQYSYNFDSQLLNRFFDTDYLNFGTDGIIRDLFYLNGGKLVWFEKPNYMMVENYAKTFNLTYTDLNKADVVYISYPNGATCKFPKIDLSNIKNKVKILDLSYYIYTLKSKFPFQTFMEKVEEFKQMGFYVLYGASKILGLPGLRVGMCKTLTPEVFSKIHQPWQITSVSKLILDKCWNADLINKHVKTIQKSKKQLEHEFSDYIAFKTDGPFLALKKTFKPLYENQVKEYPDYYTMTVVERSL